MQDNQDHIVSDWNEIEEVFNSYFQTLFQTSSPSQQQIEAFIQSVLQIVSPKMNNKLQLQFISEEAQEALKQMIHLKSFGPDGCSAYFYQLYWPIISSEVSNVVLKFLNEGVFDSNINFTYIALVPKVKNPTLTEDYKPISVCNVIYKLISKVLANRLKYLLPKFISQYTIVLSYLAD